jgi:hypothetical protein
MEYRLKNSRLLVIGVSFLIANSNYLLCDKNGSLIDSAKSKIGQATASVKDGVRRFVGHVFSWDGMKDIGASYLLCMALTTIHELGHAMASKVFYDTPLDITIGSYNKKPLFTVGGMALVGLNPLMGYTRIDYDMDHPYYDIAIYLAGPLCGALASAAAYTLLQKYVKKFYMTKSVALFVFYTQTIGLSARSDFNRVMSIIKYQL